MSVNKGIAVTTVIVEIVTKVIKCKIMHVCKGTSRKAGTHTTGN